MVLTVEEKKIRFPVDLVPANDQLADFLVILDSVTGAYTFATRVIGADNVAVDPVPQVAHDTADSGPPIKVGGKSAAGLLSLTPVAAADRLNLSGSLDGAMYVREIPSEDMVVGNASNTDGTSTEVLAAVAATKQYLKEVTITNMHATTTVYVELKSGATVRWRLPVPPGGVTKTFPGLGLPPSAENEAWNFDSSAAVTTLYFSALAVKSKV